MPWWGTAGWIAVAFSVFSWMFTLATGNGPGPQHFALLGVGALLGVAGLVTRGR